MHFSDTHIDPRPSGLVHNEDGRSVKTLKWLAQCSSEPVVQEIYGIEADLPAFAIHTGDVMEYGPVGLAWQDFEQAIAKIACPVSLVPGNHDNTWGEINHLLKGTYGDDSYSFDIGDCHFLCINSSGLLDPLPCLDRRTLDWITTDLEKIPRDKLLFIAMHHPLSGNAGYASEFDKLRLSKLLIGRRVALIMDGHWHTVHCQRWQGIDRVNGGATFGEHTGYNTVTMVDGTLRVMFRYEKESVERLQIVPLLEKKLEDVASISEYSLGVPNEPISGGQLPVQIPKLPRHARLRIWIDSDLEHSLQLPKGSNANNILLDTENLCPGWHFVSARIRGKKRLAITTAERFKLLPVKDAPFLISEANLGAGVKARPLVQDDLIIVANTSGLVVGLSRKLEKKWAYDTHSQVVHSLTAADDRILVGNISGGLHCLRATDGRSIWKISLPNSLYAASGVHGGLAYLADGAGWLHAISLNDGQIRWSREVTSYAFEAQPLVFEDRLFISSWDGFIYAVDCNTGGVIWKSWSPKGHQDVKSRYYGAADNPIVAIGGSLFANNRAWMLGSFALNGDFQAVLQDKVTSIAAGQSDHSLYAKTLDNRLVRIDRKGNRIWDAEVPTGRVPNQPVECAGQVAVLSDTGILTLLACDSGLQTLQYSISPRLYCLSGIGTDGIDTLVAADMDGTVTSLQLLDT
ncbi:outer membrane protein assembly factor BamB family protein [Bythopirellula goksoeyrii]|uniref:outer membrane protein assembly factor BamB family protein n=1 Tax=Bythopirellula goksoeyrii TaxID=1400387 RepID=UPI0021BC592B|nr:PQQ-binding-like beta-propeller repeat protein [Bythopirellula goksoeyrii]